jgi:predicted acylesterase/phospholipase RssA
MSLYVPAPRSSQRDKLGLSLAGGGFRASLFHLGVLRRMAEIDLLRYVEVLSTVSGGSIIGALYVLILQERLYAKARFDRDDYVALVKSLEDTFVSGVQQNLRTRLLMNPLGMLGVLLSHDSLGRRMGRIYQRYLYSEAVDALRLRDSVMPKGGRLSRWFWPISKRLWPGWIPLRSVHFKPGGHPILGGLEGYNHRVLYEEPRGSAIPNLIMNSTALNSGAPFRFSSVEIGDPRLGYFRYDEAEILEARKHLLDSSSGVLALMLKGNADPPQVKGTAVDLRVVALALWWITRNTRQPTLPAQTGQWTQLFGNPVVGNVIDSMCATNFGRLRKLKLPAWYVRTGTRSGVIGGGPVAQNLTRFIQVLSQVDPTVPNEVTEAIIRQNSLGNELLDFAIELYYLRSAEVMSWRLRDDFDGISLATAVAASANFPPVFPPLVVLGIYDDLHVARLGLSDGGVYDNLGITTLLDEGCSHIIASDTSAPFDEKQRISSRYIGMIARLPNVLTDNVADQQHTQLRERRHVSAALTSCAGGNPPLQDLKLEYGLDGLAFFNIESETPPGTDSLELGFDPCAVARLRTDLDSFGDMEVAALINTGYCQADRYLRAYFPGSRYSEPANPYWGAATVVPRPFTKRAADDIRGVLAVGQSRFFRSLRLRTWWTIPSWLLTVVAALAVLYFFGDRLVSVAVLVNKIPEWILNQLKNPLPIFPHLFVNHWARRLVMARMPFWQMLAIVVAIAFCVFKVWPLFVGELRNIHTAKKRKAATLMKWVRAFAPTLLLLAGLTPIWVAAGASAIAVISYVAYNKPFLWATRIR